MNQQSGQENDFDSNQLRARLSKAVNNDPQTISYEPQQARGKTSDEVLCPAAVLVPIVNRANGAHVLLTRRADDHPHHAGQISFPGGKIAAQDAGIEAAALRETHEETGVEARHIELMGHLDAHSTGTGFTIYPVVGLVEPAFDLKPCAARSCRNIRSTAFFSYIERTLSDRKYILAWP